MTAGAPHTVTFSGPAELAPLWDRFVAEYTENGKHAHKVRGAVLLNEAAFGRGAFAALNAVPDEAPGKGEIDRKNARFALEDILRALSEQSAKPACRPGRER